MPFTKVDDDDYVSPSGKHWTGKQVQAYYATNGFKHSELAMDDMNGDRGDVAPPAGHMPRSMAARCSECGVAMTVRDLPFGEMCEMCDCEKKKMGDRAGVEFCAHSDTPVTESPDHPPNPQNVHAPKGSAPAPDAPLMFNDPELARINDEIEMRSKYPETDEFPDASMQFGDWDESAHPRADDGKFASGGADMARLVKGIKSGLERGEHGDPDPELMSQIVKGLKAALEQRVRDPKDTGAIWSK